MIQIKQHKSMAYMFCEFYTSSVCIILGLIEVEELRKHVTFNKVVDAYGCLGVLQIGKIIITNNT